MEEHYDHKKNEREIINFWEQNASFTPEINSSKKPLSMFLVPPNASGPMHVGNALMIALQDILARHSRKQGIPTIWIPGTDHGGYETEITFERELEKHGILKEHLEKKNLYSSISSFVDKNNLLIKEQIKQLGASVDWSKFRYSMDDCFIKEVNRIFNQMLEEKLICKRHAMNYFCSTCSTILSDIELKEKKGVLHYFIKFALKHTPSETISVAIKHPEFISTITHILIHPQNRRYSHLIGKQVTNPFNGNTIDIIASKRKFDYEKEKIITPLFQDYVKYDYEYAIMHGIPASNQNLIDWDGNMCDPFPQKKPLEVRELVITSLEKNNAIEKVESLDINPELLCKKGHLTQTITTLTWFLDLDKENASLKKAALAELEKNPINIYPAARKNEVFRWIDLMKFWPIARQNTWGIKIPAWYDVSIPSHFFVWFIDKDKKRHHGNLETFLKNDFTLDEISTGLEKIYTSKPDNWVLEKKDGTSYLPETDVFDSWFSGIWSALVFGKIDSQELSYFYPNHSLIIGHDLVRLCVSREIVINYYLTKKIPFKNVFFHGLIKGTDGQKMSKSLGNVVPLEYYLDKFGADVTRLTLVSYVDYDKDFIVEENRLVYFKDFINKLWTMARVAEIAQKHITTEKNTNTPHALLDELKNLDLAISGDIENLKFISAQDRCINFLTQIEEYAYSIKQSNNQEEGLLIFKSIFEKYLNTLHPFAPFCTEKINQIVFQKNLTL